jgi:hypothetical protein
MDENPTRHVNPAHEDGFATIEYLAAVMLSLLLLVAVANVIVVQYARGVLRAAVDEGVRDGARLMAESGREDVAVVVARCQHRVDEVRSNLLRGTMADGLTARCTATDSQVTATVEGHFDGWLPGMPDFDAATVGTATREASYS